MAELLSTDSITVLGGPAKIQVDLDFGPTGQRGSQWFVGDGNPNMISIGQTPKVLDMFLNVGATDEEYLSIYQYQSVTGSNTWVRLLNLIPNFYSKNVLTEFISGEAVITIPLINILPQNLIGVATSDNFNIQHSMIDSETIISNITALEIITDNSVQALQLTFKSLKLSSTDWVPFEGQKIVNLFISVV